MRQILLALMLCLQGCTVFGPDTDALAAKFGFSKKQLAGSGFEHIVFESGLRGETGPELHVYIEGDGIPWKYGRFPAADPSPRRPLALELMAQDHSPSIYVGRPCYFGLARSKNCGAPMWTARRYSREVIDSMAAVIRVYQQRYDTSKLVLIGYSGGGAIAALLAAELSGPRYLLTVAANLDTDLWIRQFGFLPLEGSLNPIHQIETLQAVPQLHLMGAADTVVPNNVTLSYTRNLPAKASRSYAEFDHSCCWKDIWESLLQEKPWAASYPSESGSATIN